MNKVEVKFGDWIEKGFELYKNNFAILAVAGLLTFLLSVITLGILGGPMMAGLTMVTLALRDGAQPKPQGTDVTKGFQFFLPSFLFVVLYIASLLVFNLVVGWIPCLGQLLSAAASWAICTVTVFAMCNIVDRKMEAVPAIKASLEVVKTNFWMFMAFAVVASVIGGLGIILCFIGVALTLPITVCMVVVAYRDVAAQQATPVPPA